VPNKFAESELTRVQVRPPPSRPRSGSTLSPGFSTVEKLKTQVLRRTHHDPKSHRFVARSGKYQTNAKRERILHCDDEDSMRPAPIFLAGVCPETFTHSVVS